MRIDPWLLESKIVRGIFWEFKEINNSSLTSYAGQLEKHVYDLILNSIDGNSVLLKVESWIKSQLGRRGISDCKENKEKSE